jgi:hypothetical protein
MHATGNTYWDIAVCIGPKEGGKLNSMTDGGVLPSAWRDVAERQTSQKVKETRFDTLRAESQIHNFGSIPKRVVLK